MEIYSLLILLILRKVHAYIDTSPLACDSDTFGCDRSRQCIPMSFRCDGETDCYDNSDEENCDTSQTTTISPGSACNKQREFTCVSGGCVDYKYMCDGNYDCGDHSDERFCNIQQSTTQHPKSSFTICNMQYEYTCTNRKCISSHDLCNGINDCGDNSDEAYCNILRPSTNSSPRTTQSATISSCNTQNEYTCVNRKCVSRHQMCNGVNDCGDNSDEAYCNQIKTSTNTPTTRRHFGWVTVLG